MKKVLLAIMILVLSATTLTGCGAGKEPITSEEFKEYFSDDYTTTEVSDDFDDSIKVVLNATSDDIIIEYFEFTDNDSATYFFNQIVNEYEIEKEYLNVRANTKTNTNNYGSYKLTTDSRYLAVVRVENTVIGSSVSKEFKDEVKDIIKDLGY